MLKLFSANGGHLYKKDNTVPSIFVQSKERYDLIYYDNIKNFKLLNENKGVTTIGDECNQVE